MQFVQRMPRNISGVYSCQKLQRQVLEQPIRAKIPSIQPIKRDPKPLINGLLRFSRAFHRLDDFTFSFVNQKTLASVIGCVISVTTCPNRSNHLLQNARVPKFSLMTFRSCLALGNLVIGNMDKNYCRIIVYGYNLYWATQDIIKFGVCNLIDQKFSICCHGEINPFYNNSKTHFYAT